MRARWRFGLAAAGVLAAGSVIAAQQLPGPPSTPRVQPAVAYRTLPNEGLVAFSSDAELRRFLQRTRRSSRSGPAVMAESATTADAAASAPPALSAPAPVQGRQAYSPNITNRQEADVDEGGIVKVSGDTLVILRRGRLHTVSLAGGRMRPVDTIEAYPPGAQAHGDWYDEMLLLGDRVIVVGYSYSRGGTEINRFRLDRAGRLTFEDAHHLRSNDYYSSRNYASRLIGNRLVFYTPLFLGWDRDPLEALPGLRRWRPGVGRDAFRPIATARDIYIAPGVRDAPEPPLEALHSVTTCDLAAPVLQCSAVGVLGPASRTFYVSGRSVYLWISDAGSRAGPRAARSHIYRLPFAGERPSAVAARGAPVDQFSFREDPQDGLLNVLLRADGGGDWMFRPEASEGSVALLRVPFRDFGDGSREVAPSRYRPLPSPAGGDSWSFRNRFVGDHVLYAAGAYGGEPMDRDATVVAAPLRGGRPALLPVPHGVDRIEALGRDALAVGGGGGGNLHFTAVELPGSGARLGDRYVLPEASEGETRSHAFFFSPDPRSPDGGSGVMGLPVARAMQDPGQRFFGSSAAMMFLRRDQRRFSPAGELAAAALRSTEDGCVASCVDWYGNARPIFLGSRTFALLGYELVEGDFRGGRIREVARVDFTPPGRRSDRGE